MELFYAEKHHVLVSRVRISVNQAAPIELLTFFLVNILRKMLHPRLAYSKSCVLSVRW